MNTEQLLKAFTAFDAYNTKDPNTETHDGQTYPKEVLYAQRMTDMLNHFAPDAPEQVQLTARCQHIGRWEIAREDYAMDKKGYLLWRSMEKKHQVEIATKILTECAYDQNTIDIVNFLLLKKQLQTNPDTQLVEDVVCLVFIKYYLEDFANKHGDEKVVDILKKTMLKMSPRAIENAVQFEMSPKIKSLLEKAAED